MFHVAARDFSDDERMTEDQIVVQQASEHGGVRSKMIDPHGRIH